jgi:hypothetical protein
MYGPVRLFIGCTRTGFIKKKLPMVKIIFTIFSVVELKSTGATFAYLKCPSISAFLGFLPFICCSVCEFRIFPNGGKI